MYSGSPRAFSRVFRSHLVNLLASSPYTVHLYFHTFAAEFRWSSGAEAGHYHSINDTLRYYDSFINLDGQRVDLMTDCLQAFGLDHSTLDDIRLQYAEQLAYVIDGGAWSYGNDQPKDFEAAVLLGMLHSQWAANELRHAVMRRTGVEYRWVLRMHMDMLLRTNVWDAVFDRTPYDPLLSDHVSLQQRAVRPFAHALFATLLHDTVYRARIDPSVCLLPNGQHGSLPYGWNDQWALMNSTTHDAYTDRVSLDSVKAMFSSSPPGFSWAAETSLRRTLERYGVPVQISDRLCYSIVRTLLTGADGGERGAMVGMLAPAAFAQRSACTLMTQFGAATYGIDVCDAVCPAVRTMEAAQRAAIRRRLTQAAANVSDSSPYAEPWATLSAFVPSFPWRDDLSWAAAYRAYALLEHREEWQPPSLPEALLPLYLLAQDGERPPSLSASNYAL